MDVLWTDERGEWTRTHDEILGFLHIGTTWIEDAFERLYEEIGRRPSSGEEEWIDVFDRATHGVGLGRFPRLVMAAALRDGVTAFEVHLEKAREIILNFVGLTATHRTDARAPRWSELVEFFKLFGVEVATSGVADVRDRRHVLTHKRGEIRQQKDERLSHASPDEDAMQAVPNELHLTVDGVRGDLETLATMVRTIDAQVVERLFPPPGSKSDETGTPWLMNELALWSLDKLGFRTID